ncbi:MAG: carboxypeptidase regulatory-like domain-containing protein, partial [Chlamydiota bacterium]
MWSHLSEKKLTLISVSVLLFVACFGSLALLAQVTSGAIFGSVKDQSGAYVAKATVTVSNPATGVKRTVATGQNGEFVVPNLLPGTYAIAVEASGFSKVEKTNIILSAADRLDAGEFVLHVGATSAVVTVTADAAQLQLQSNSGERSDLITGKQLNDVALNGRMVLDYMRLIPGVVSDFDGSASTTYGIGAFNVNGTRANTHEYTIDGSSNVDTGDNATTHVTINPDAIAEMKVLTSNYQAEFGKAGGGQVAVVTKSGTNQFHGNVRFFHRNEGMNANNWFADQANAVTPGSVPIALYRYNYFGYQVGGPV